MSQSNDTLETYGSSVDSVASSHLSRPLLVATNVKVTLNISYPLLK